MDFLAATMIVQSEAALLATMSVAETTVVVEAAADPEAAAKVAAADAEMKAATELAATEMAAAVAWKGKFNGEVKTTHTYYLIQDRGTRLN